MSLLHPNLTDAEYWKLRFKLLNLQKEIIEDPAVYEQLRLDLIEDLNNYIKKEADPWV